LTPFKIKCMGTLLSFSFLFGRHGTCMWKHWLNINNYYNLQTYLRTLLIGTEDVPSCDSYWFCRHTII
jgi:hypothetical protein